uniref:Recombinant streptomycin adenylyltransferase n=1 Tax=Corynebacterium acetoacidophilum TaxID=38285 RepID=Q2XV32_9CORY|nr:recombinant streptomycin adenylyltransferase [Corynebacterium acetoacidophilum]
MTSTPRLLQAIQQTTTAILKTNLVGIYLHRPFNQLWIQKGRVSTKRRKSSAPPQKSRPIQTRTPVTTLERHTEVRRQVTPRTGSPWHGTKRKSIRSPQATIRITIKLFTFSLPVPTCFTTQRESLSCTLRLGNTPRLPVLTQYHVYVPVVAPEVYRELLRVLEGQSPSFRARPSRGFRRLLLTWSGQKRCLQVPGLTTRPVRKSKTGTGPLYKRRQRHLGAHGSSLRDIWRYPAKRELNSENGSATTFSRVSSSFPSSTL